jgi:hypothetical protein
VADSIGHAGHDPVRVAEAMDRGAQLAPVLRLCVRCVALYVDLVSLTAALPKSALPRRPRAFTLTAADAARLRPGGWRGWWSAVGSARDTLTRPLAIGITTLGLAGLLLTAAPTLRLGLGGAASSGAMAPEAESPAASLLPSDRTLGAAGPAASGDPNAPTSQVTSAPSPEGPSPTLLLSVGLVLVGAGLFAVRRVASHGQPVR